MTNEEKVATIVGRARAMLPMMRSQLGDSVTGYAEYFKKSLLKMAEWKDQQFKDAINSTLDYFDRGREAGFVSENSYNDMKYFASKVINELFKED